MLRRMCALSVCLFFSGGCVHYVQLGAVGEAGGSTPWRCRPSTEAPADAGLPPGSLEPHCDHDTEHDLSRWNVSPTYYALPSCPNGIHRILVGGDEVLVECAAPRTEAGHLELDAGTGDE